MQIVTVRGSSNDCAAVGLGPKGRGCMFIVRGGWVRVDGGGPSTRLAPWPSATKRRHCSWFFQMVLYGAGGKVGFFQGDIRLLPDDMKNLQPTIFPVVPRLLNRVYDKVSSKRR